MMFLIEKGNEQTIITQHDLAWQMKDGWKIVKPLPDCPFTVKTMACSKRSPKQIIEWYNFKIDITETKIKRLRKELAKFQQMIK